MKKTILYSLLATTIFLTACKKDDDASDVTKTVTIINLDETVNDEAINSTEEFEIDVATLKSGIEIPSGDFVDALPPASNADLGLDLESTDVDGFKETGFSINFSTTDEIAGAYFRIKNTDGEYVNGYYDITDFDTENSRVASKKNKRGNSSKIAVADDYILDINFNENIPAGIFCVEICVYDASNNVGEIQTVCIEIEAWGGLENIADAYRVTSMDYLENGSITETEYLENGEWDIEMKPDGTYIESFDNGDDVYYGKWAYNEVDKTLTTIDFVNVYKEDGETITEEYENGSLYFEGVSIEANQDKMSWSDTFEDDNITFKEIVNFQVK